MGEQLTGGHTRTKHKRRFRLDWTWLVCATNTIKEAGSFYHKVECQGKDDDAEEGPKDALPGKLVPLKEPALEALP